MTNARKALPGFAVSLYSNPSLLCMAHAWHAAISLAYVVEDQ